MLNSLAPAMLAYPPRFVGITLDDLRAAHARGAVLLCSLSNSSASARTRPSGATSRVASTSGRRAPLSRFVDILMSFYLYIELINEQRTGRHFSFATRSAFGARGRATGPCRPGSRAWCLRRRVPWHHRRASRAWCLRHRGPRYQFSGRPRHRGLLLLSGCASVP